MSSDIISSLHLDKKFDLSRVLVAKEINGGDSSFLVNCILGHCVRNTYPVLIIATHNSLSHYQNVGLTMNYNLQKHIDSGLVHFYNLGEEFVNTLLLDKDVLLQTAILTIKDKVKIITEKYNTINIILDGISHLFDLQFSLKDVNTYCRDIITLVKSYDNSFVLFLCNVACENDVTCVIANLLSHKAYTVLEVENLSSGWSPDVSGHLTVKHPGRKFEDEHLFTMDIKPTRYLYKLFAGGVKLFAPGTV